MLPDGDFMEALLTVEQAAQRLQMTPKAIREQLARGTLRGIKRGRVWRVPESALTEHRDAAPARDVRVFTVSGTLSEALTAIAAARDELRAATSGPLDAARDLAALRGEPVG